MTKWKTPLVYAGGYIVKTVSWADRTVKPGMSCMNCIGGGGVWCSNTFNYWLTGDANYTYLATTALTAVDTGIADSVAKMTAGTADRGTCCNSNIKFTEFIGYVG